MNCWTAPCSMGPRQMIGWSGGTSMPIEITLMPCASRRNHLLVAAHLRLLGRCRASAGCWGRRRRRPCSPTRAPFARSATARLTAVVDLPTPPLPAPTAMMLRMPGIVLAAECRRARARWRSSSARAAVTPGSAATCCSASAFISSFTGQAGVVSSIVKSTSPPSIRDVLHEAEGDDVLVQVGVLHRPQGVEHLVLVTLTCSSLGSGASAVVDRLLQRLELAGGAADDLGADAALAVDHERGREARGRRRRRRAWRRCRAAGDRGSCARVTKSSISFGSPESKTTPTTSTPRRLVLACRTRGSRGISSMQGPHQVAQKSSTTTLPLRSACLTRPPARSGRSKLGAGP